MVATRMSPVELSTTLDGKEIHLGYSRINSFLNCPKQYMHTYVEGIRSPSGVPQRRGTAYHNTLEHLLNYKRINGDLLGLTTAERVAIKKAKAEKLTDAEIYRVIDAVRFYYKEMYLIHEPLLVEEPFEFVRGGIKLTGRIDLIEYDGTITDHKFSYDTWAKERAEGGCQPIIYQWAGLDYLEPKYGVKYKGFAYNIIRLYPAPVIQKIDIPIINKQKSDWWEGQLVHMARSIRYSIFPATPSTSACRYCDHKKLCKPPTYDIIINTFGDQSRDINLEEL